MPILLGLDLGTTSITAIALEAPSGELLACSSAANRAEVTSPADKALGRSEWDANGIVELALDQLRALAEQLGERTRELVGLGITGQQHGVLLVNAQRQPITPLINWQDRRGDEPFPASHRTFVEEANARAGQDAAGRTGCRLATGYMAITLFWLLTNHHRWPASTSASFIVDYLGSLLCGHPIITDATCAASSGAFNIAQGEWDAALLSALELPRNLFAPIRRSGDHLGNLQKEYAARAGLPSGLPVFVGIGDNQASFLGSVAVREDTVLVNVGTGGQVSAYCDRPANDPMLEARPFPRGGFLQVAAGLSGGAAYAALERFLRRTAELAIDGPLDPLFSTMNRLAAAIPPGAGGLRFEPFFFGTRMNPEWRGSLSGISVENFTPAHLTRAVLEGMARTFAAGAAALAQSMGRKTRLLVGAGNGVRSNPLLARLIAGEIGLPMTLPMYREEAARGAALLAGVGAGVFADLASACATVQQATLDEALAGAKATG
jgi:sugar (pentulose or hexulose) kinase